MRKFVILVCLLLLSLNAIPLIEGYSGEISNTLVDTYEWDAQEGRTPNFVRLNNSDYYLIVFGGETGTEYDGYLRTIKVWNTNGTIQKSAVSTYEFHNSDISTLIGIQYPRILQIPNSNIYAIAFQDRLIDKKIKVSTFKVWDTNGTIYPGAIDSILMTYNGTYIDFDQVSGSVYAVAYSNVADNDGFLETIWINTTGTINNTILSTKEFDVSNAYCIDLCPIDSDTLAICYQWSGGDGNLQTWNISSAGAITATVADSWEFDPSDLMSPPRMINIYGDVYAIFYTTTGKVGKVVTISVANTGMITKSFIDSDLRIPLAQWFYVSQINIGSVYTFGYRGGTNATYPFNVSTINISNTGVVADSLADTLQMTDISSGFGGPVMYLGNSFYMAMTEGSGYDGFAYTFTVQTNSAAPVISSSSPTNTSTGISLTPKCNITVGDIDNNPLNIYFYENISGSWVLRQTNSSVSNGTYRWVFEQALNGLTTYYWKVSVNDSVFNTSSWYKFTTASIPYTIWFVSTTGSDTTGTGNINNPFKTLQKAINVSSTNDTIYMRAGTHIPSQTTFINRSGTSSIWFTVSNYPGETVIINGSNANSGDKSLNATIMFKGSDYARFTGITVDWSKTGGISLTSSLGTCDYIRIDNCTISNSSTFAIRSYLGNTYLYIENNYLYNNFCNWYGHAAASLSQEIISLSGVSRGYIFGNRLWKNRVEQIDMKSGCNWMYVYDNIINTTASGVLRNFWLTGGIGIYIDARGVTHNISIYKNLIYGNHTGIQISNEGASGRYENISVFNNVINVTNTTGGNPAPDGRMGIHVGMEGTSTSVNKDIKIYMNNFILGAGNKYQCLKIGSTAKPITTSLIRRLNISNNIFANNNKTHTSWWQYLNTAHIEMTGLSSTDGAMYIKFNNNLYNNSFTGTCTPRISWSDGNWDKSTPSKWGNSPLFTKPLFVSPNPPFDFSLNVSSPCINTATSSLVVPIDFIGTTRPQAGAYDIGAYEYVGVSILIDSDSKFTLSYGVTSGTGTDVDPYLIDLYPSVYSITVHSTTKSFTVQNCTVLTNLSVYNTDASSICRIKNVKMSGICSIWVKKSSNLYLSMSTFKNISYSRIGWW